MLRIALRPRWIGALLLALAVAAAFALLSQWQLSRSISEGTVVDRPTEMVVALQDVVQPQTDLPAPAEGQRVTVSGLYNPADTVILSDRINHGESGFWVVGHLTTAEGAGVAVALGWTASESQATKAMSDVAADSVTVTGRLVGDEGPQTSDFQSGELHALSMGAMVNLWSTVDEFGVYNGYVVSASPLQGLEAISAPPPDTSVELNWLNLFYAAEWVIFAGFAVFLWWRLVRDVWEREHAT
ncbi:MAG: SURF1 family cytochrome oxidase biogenesis protein [Terrimesophilobacter sp.]